MADPVTIGMAGVSLATTIGGAMTSAAGASQAADAQTAMYNYKAQVAQQNQQIAQQNALYETQRGGVQAQFAGMQAAQKMGLITSEQAASGIDINTGTATQVRSSQLAGAQTEQGTIRSDAARRAYGEEIQGLNQEQQAQLDTMAGRQAQIAKGYQVDATLLGGASSVADKWMSYSKQGVFGNTSGSGNIFGGLFGGGSPSGYG